MKPPKVKIKSFLDQFSTMQKAAEALGLKSRQTWYDWEKEGKTVIPEPWAWKAKALMDSGETQ